MYLSESINLSSPIETITVDDSLNENIFWQMCKKKHVLIISVRMCELLYVLLLLSCACEVSRRDESRKAYRLNHRSLEITFTFSSLFIV